MLEKYSKYLIPLSRDFPYHIYENFNLTIEKTRLIDKTWKERLLSWKPWIKTKTEIYREPDPNIYVGKFGPYDECCIVCHPTMVYKIKQEWHKL